MVGNSPLPGAHPEERTQEPSTRICYLDIPDIPRTSGVFVNTNVECDSKKRLMNGTVINEGTLCIEYLFSFLSSFVDSN